MAKHCSKCCTSTIAYSLYSLKRQKIETQDNPLRILPSSEWENESHSLPDAWPTHIDSQILAIVGLLIALAKETVPVSILFFHSLVTGCMHELPPVRVWASAWTDPSSNPAAVSTFLLHNHGQLLNFARLAFSFVRQGASSVSWYHRKFSF